MRKRHVISVVASTITLGLMSPTFLVYCESDTHLVSKSEAIEAMEDVATPVETSSRYPVIGSLETRRGMVVIMSSPDGPLYSVKNKSGSVVSRELSEKQLQARHPEIYNHIKGAVAGRGLWAGM